MSTKKSNSVDFNYLNSAKAKKGKEEFLEETKSWKGGSHKERHEAQKDSRGLKKKFAQRPEKASWRKKATGIAIVGAVCLVGLLNFISTVFGFLSGAGVQAIDVKDSAKLKTILFGGEPWLIYCVNNKTVNERLPTVLEDSYSSLWSSLGVQVGVLRCWDSMESGRSVAQRFKLKLSPPVTFAVANGDKPKLVDLIGVSKTEHLEKKLKPLLRIQAERIDKLKEWTSKCTGRRTCIVIGHKQSAQKTTAMNLLTPLVEKNRNIKFVTLDTSFWQLKLDESILKTRPGREGEKQKGADVLCLARDESEMAGGNNTFSGTFLQQLTANAAGSFVSACGSRTDLVQMPGPPKLSARQRKPKVIKASSPPSKSSRPAPRPPPPRKKERTNVDRVGSRVEMERQEQEEALFEAVDPEEADDDEASGEQEEGAEASSGEEGDDGEESEQEEGQNSEDSEDEQVEL
jgi:hypothetical protein